MMEKLSKGVETTNAGVTMINSDLSSMIQIVDSHSTSIKKLEQQMTQLSTALNQWKSGTLPIYMLQIPQNNGLCMVITSCSGKVLPGPTVGKSVIDDMVELDEEEE